MFDSAHLQRARARVAELESQLADPALSADRKRFQLTLGEHRRQQALRDTLEQVVALRRRAEEAREMQAAESDPEWRALAQQELAAVEADLPAAERAATLALVPPDPRDERAVIMEIRAGTGGEEAALFAADLFRLYSRFAEGRGWKVALLDVAPSDHGGYKEIVYTIEGPEAYRWLKFESGTHRVQRVPATEASGRIHTSAATVAVLPEAEESDDIAINPADLRIDVYRASGAGGQHVNKTDSAVRITHLPSGVVVACQEERSQHKNRDKAMRLLKARLWEAQFQSEQAKLSAERRAQIGSGDRSERIRTYNYPQNRLTDHRIDLTLYSLDRILEGDLEPVARALYEHDLEARLRQTLSGTAETAP
jgi:peptide chain release factor 1